MSTSTIPGYTLGTAAVAMHAAWFKAVTLQVTLWSEPYVAPSAF